MKSIIEIDGMTCSHCIMAVRKELEKISGLRVMELGVGKAVVEADAASLNADSLRSAVERAGYRVRSVQ